MHGSLGQPLASLGIVCRGEPAFEGDSLFAVKSLKVLTAGRLLEARQRLRNPVDRRFVAALCLPYQWAPPIARICQIIGDQWDREETGLNYAFDRPPPSHKLLDGFLLGSNHWFRALWSLLKM